MTVVHHESGYTIVITQDFIPFLNMKFLATSPDFPEDEDMPYGYGSTEEEAMIVLLEHIDQINDLKEQATKKSD